MSLDTTTLDPHKKNDLSTNQLFSQVDCIDLFCGLGGLTHGLIRE
jgi:hypothetical protein